MTGAFRGERRGFHLPRTCSGALMRLMLHGFQLLHQVKNELQIIRDSML